MKNKERIVIISGALIVLVAAFMIDRQRCKKDMDVRSQRAPVVKQSDDLCVRNVTGSQVKAALYTKRMRRRGDVMNVPATGKCKGKLKIKRSKQAPILAVARRRETLGEQISQSVPHVKTSRVKSVTVQNAGYDLVVTPSSCKKH